METADETVSAKSSANDDLLEACELLVRCLGNWMDIADEEDVREYDEEAMRKGVAAIIKAKSRPS